MSFDDENRGKIGRVLEKLSGSSFRRSFSLEPHEARVVVREGLGRIREQARAIVRDRLGPAVPDNDGKQTPMRGHAVFIAQHATATCCRGCLAKWHGIGKGAELTSEQVAYIAEVITAWIKQKCPEAKEMGLQGVLF